MKTHSSIHLSVPLSVQLIFGMHVPCDKPFQLVPCHDLHLELDLLKGQSYCRVGDHNSPNLLVVIYWDLIVHVQ